MSELEDLIRQSLRSEADRLHEVDPLRLPPAGAPRRARRGFRGPRPRAWYAPLAAAAVIVLVAAGLGTVRALRTDAHALRGNGTGATSSSGSAAAPSGRGSAATPRYYVYSGAAKPGSGSDFTIAVGDVQADKTIGSYTLPPGDTVTMADSGAADDRMFVVETGVFKFVAKPVIPPPSWYLVRIVPGSADPVRVTPLHLQATPSTAVATYVTSVALSADGNELAVATSTGTSVALGVYSMATGRLQHSWSAAVKVADRVDTPLSDPSWVSDHTVAFAYVYTPNVSQEVRTIQVSAGGSSLLGDSHAIWSQVVPRSSAKHAPTTCDTPYLSGDGTAVVCATSSYSASTKRLTALWLAYPVATPTRPRVIGSVTEPKNVTSFNGPNQVGWVNASGTEVVGYWNPGVPVVTKNVVGTSVTNDQAFIGHGQIRMFPWISGGFVAW